MKKAIWLAVLLLIGMRAHAASDPKVLAFLQQLNKYYYCLNREGLKTFKCEVTFSFINNVKTALAEKYGANDKRVKALQNLKFTLEFQGGDKWVLNSGSVDKTGDKDFDDSIAQLIQAPKMLVDGFMELFLKNLVIDNQFSDKDMAEADFKVVKNTTGFQILSSKKDVSLTLDYDPSDRTTNATYSSGGKMIMSFQPTYFSYPKGILPNLLKVQIPSEKIEKSFGVEYLPVSGLQLPTTLDYKEHPTAPGSEDFEALVTFKNYKIN